MAPKRYRRFIFMGVFILGLASAWSQDASLSGTELIDQLLGDDRIEEAQELLTTQIAALRTAKLHDSLYPYPYFVGKVSALKNTTAKGIKDAERFLEDIKKETSNYRTIYRSQLDLADLYDEFGENTKSLYITTQALKNVLLVQDAKPEEVGKVKYNLGACYISVNDVQKGGQFFKSALKDYESSTTTPKKLLSDGYNATGAIMWMSTKLDSAQYYYKKAIKTIESAQGEPIENLYNATVIQSNISLLQYTEGNLSEALATQEVVIANYEKVIDEINDEIIRSKAQRFQARAISNLAAFYNEVGNLSKSHEISNYAYQKKKLFLEPDDRELATSLINIGQSFLSLQEYDLAIEKLNEGITKLETSSGDYAYWKAAALYAKAQALAAKNELEVSKQLYAESEQLFDRALGDNYDIEYLGFLRNKALFLSQSEAKQEAISTASKAHDYVLKNNQDSNFPVLKHKLNLAKVYYNLGDYTKTIAWCKNGNDFLSEEIKNSASGLDTVLFEFRRPALLLLQAKAEYQLTENKDAAFLKSQIATLEEAFSTLERRKTISISKEDNNILFSEYRDLYEFSKQLHFDVYNLTNNPEHLSKAISLHESSVYQRIRSKLNGNNLVGFANVPPQILEREKILKDKIQSALENPEGKDDALSSFFEETQAWNQFLDSLKQAHPKYYKMRYATIEESLDNVASSIPEKTTVIRYLFIDNTLYAFISTNNDTRIIELDFEPVKGHILEVHKHQFEVEKIAPLLHELYTSLWQPFEHTITTQNVIIIPDRELFNLSFETLTPSLINSFKELATNSLLAKHAISYNFSLLLLENNPNVVPYKDDFIAFAPEFTAAMKDQYKISITDSVALDRTYLTLLPQPFSKDLVKRFSKQFDGASFVNEKASKKIFQHSAGEHKIIHIGTHAESNNISPELSRLIFAKNAENDSLINDNSLYTFEIYNCNLSAELAILTACETGKPSYQAGEGMISLAHAFNYAGSQSILTSLWKIDEQSSAEIVSLFYENLSDGLPKNTALQRAKLDYLSKAEGRTLAPQYWGGLVLIGNTTPIELSQETSWSLWILLGVIGVFLLFLLLKKRRA